MDERSRPRQRSTRTTAATLPESSAEIERRVKQLHRMCGQRYDACTLENYVIETESQRDVVIQLRDYITNLRANILAGRGLILFGPRGTGKDHMLMAVMRAAVRIGLEVSCHDSDPRHRDTIAWRNGIELLSTFRTLIGDESENDFYASLVAHRVLAISDPIPPVGSVSEFQAAGLFRVFDGRYRWQRPTWLTVNVETGDELDSRIGAQAADRLIDGSLKLYCNWESYRK